MKPLDENKARKFQIGLANSLGFRIYADSLKMQKDLDPLRAVNKKLASILASAGVSVRYMTGDAAFDLAKSDASFSVTYLALPIGFTPDTDQGNVAVVDGMHDGKIPIAVLTEYGIETRNLGDEIEMSEFVSLLADFQAANKKELEAEVKATAVLDSTSTID